MAEALRKGDFNLEDFLAQMQQVKKMGSMQSIVVTSSVRTSTLRDEPDCRSAMSSRTRSALRSFAPASIVRRSYRTLIAYESVCAGE